VLPSFVIYKSHDPDEESLEGLQVEMQERMNTLESTRPITFRKQNGGDCTAPSSILKDIVELEGQIGFGLHVENEGR
jgi:NAD(P)H dehydrogenase (quinone)